MLSESAKLDGFYTTTVPNSLQITIPTTCYLIQSTEEQRESCQNLFELQRQSKKKIIDPFDPEASVPLPFQLDDQYGPYSTSVWKRNERERCRVRCVNEGYDSLRNHLPIADSEKRISKVDTLRLAIRYIRHLNELLKDEQHVYRCRCFEGFKEESEGNIQVDIQRTSAFRAFR